MQKKLRKRDSAFFKSNNSHLSKPVNLPKKRVSGNIDFETVNRKADQKIETEDLEKESFKSGIATWTRWTSGLSLLLSPFYFKSLGCICAVSIFVLTYFLNYYAYTFIYKASFYANSDFFPDVIEKILGKTYANIFRVTYFYDLTSGYLLSLTSSWQLFEFLLKTGGLIRTGWVITNEGTYEFDEYNSELIIVRVCFFSFVFAICFQFLFKQRMAELNNFLTYYLNVFLIVVILILVQMPFYYKKYQNENALEYNFVITKPSFEWIESSFNILYVLYLQPYVLYFKQEMAHPTYELLSQITKYSTLIQSVVNLVFGMIVYFSLGDKFTPYWLLDKKPLDRFYIEEIISLGILLLFIMNNLTIALYGLAHKSLLANLLGIKDYMNEHHLRLSIFPLALLCGVGILIPNTYRYIYPFSTAIFIFNSYITPAILQLALLKKEANFMRQHKKNTKIIIFIVFFVGAAIVGQGINIYNFFY